MEEGVPIESRMITRRIEAAQKAVEGQNFEARKHLLEYDDVMNKQREAVYGLRRRLLEGLDQKDLIIEDYVSAILGEILEQFCAAKAHVDDWDLKGLKDAIFTRFGVDIFAEGVKPETMNRAELGDAIFDKLKERYDAKEKLIGADAMRYHERMIMLSVIDAQWKDHLLSMDHLKEGIGLRGYAQHDPLVEYKRESFDMFEEMMKRFQEETARYLYLMQVLERPADATAPPRGLEVRRNQSPMPVRPRWLPEASGATVVRHARLQPRWTRSKRLSSARRSANWSRLAWRAPATCRSSRSYAPAKRSDGTIHAPVAAGRNTRNAAEPAARLDSAGRVRAPVAPSFTASETVRLFFDTIEYVRWNRWPLNSAKSANRATPAAPAITTTKATALRRWMSVRSRKRPNRNRKTREFQDQARTVVFGAREAFSLASYTRRASLVSARDLEIFAVSRLNPPDYN